MKELSIEEKARRYDLAIKVAKSNYETIVQMDEDCTFAKEGIVNTFHHMFPELKENKDESIRKWLIEMVEEIRKANPTNADHNGKCSEAIAWLENQCKSNMGISEATKQRLEDNLNKALEKETPESCNEFLEKQGEQKDVSIQINPSEYINDMGGNGCYLKNTIPNPIDKVAPKFHKGDWVILTAGELSTTLQIVNVDTNKKLYWFNDNSYLPIVDEECLHLWTIQDAKDGDVLCSGQMILLFKKWECSNWNFVIAYAGIDISGKLQITDGHWLISNDTHPATKEQRELLFQKMKEAGYEWDSEKKELKKIGKKHNDWSEEDELMQNNIIRLLVRISANTRTDSTSPNFSYPREIEWLKSLKERYAWKPSLAQMNALSIVSKGNAPDDMEAIVSLYNDLKKLKG